MENFLLCRFDYFTFWEVRTVSWRRWSGFAVDLKHAGNRQRHQQKSAKIPLALRPSYTYSVPLSLIRSYKFSVVAFVFWHLLLVTSRSSDSRSVSLVVAEELFFFFTSTAVTNSSEQQNVYRGNSNGHNKYEIFVFGIRTHSGCGERMAFATRKRAPQPQAQYLCLMTLFLLLCSRIAGVAVESTQMSPCACAVHVKCPNNSVCVRRFCGIWTHCSRYDDGRCPINSMEFIIVYDYLITLCILINAIGRVTSIRCASRTHHCNVCPNIAVSSPVSSNFCHALMSSISCAMKDNKVRHIYIYL